MAIARLSSLSYWYPGAAAPALDAVNLDLDGGVTLVTGPSGGGKSTLLRVLNGLVPHFHGGRIAGRAEVAGLDVFATPTRRLAQHVGFVFQDPELQTVYDTVEREVAFGLENAGVPRHAMRTSVDDALDGAGVAHLARRRVRSLSGGERQRVAIASALVTRPRAVVLDEPTSQLDPDGAELVLQAVSDLAGTGRSVVISEHRVSELAGAATVVIEVQSGRVQRADPRVSIRRPAAQAVRRQSAAGAEAWVLERVSAGFDGRPVLDGITLAGRTGEVLALSGPNGGGKTTLLRVIAGTLAPRAGRVERRDGRIAYLPQNPSALLHRPTVRSEIELTLERAGDNEQPEVVLAALGLSAVSERYPRDLSSGERQRAALAAVLPGRPGLVLLDEPTRGMDEPARDALIGLVVKLRDFGASIVLATHDAALQRALADRIVLVRDGQVTEVEAACS